MKYLLRSLKYFVQMAVILCLVLLILVKLKLANGDLQTMFVNGYDSLWQIGLLLLAFSALYPRIGYGKRAVRALGSYDEVRPVVMEVMDNLGYRLETENGEDLTFVKRAPLVRAMRMWEDRITLTRSMEGFVAEGLTKDIVRVASAVEYKAGGGGE